MNIEQELSTLDFSSLSKVKDILFSRLMAERSRRVELDEEELELLAAAGNQISLPNDTKFE